MASERYYIPYPVAFQSNGNPAAGSKTYFYLSGTSTFTPVYSDAALTTPQANPVIANAAGKIPTVWLDASKLYRVRITTSGGTLLNEEDPVVPGVTGIKGDPGGNVMSVGLFTDIPLLTIPDGVDIIQTSGYRAVGIGAARYFRWASPFAALPAGGEGKWWYTSNGATKKWYLDYSDLELFQLGAYADYVRTGAHAGTVTHDDYDAWLNYVSLVGWIGREHSDLSAYRSAPRLRLLFSPFGSYYSSDTWDCDFATVRIVGEYLGSQNGGSPVEITFANGKTGIRVHYTNTSEATTRAAGIGALDSVIENIYVRTNGAGGTTDADGFRLRAHSHLINCGAMNFIRHGANFRAGVGSGGANEGNTNVSEVVGGHYFHNGEDGVHFEEADSNASRVIGANFYGNGRWAIKDKGFLGSSAFACHADNNGSRAVSGPTYAVNAEGALTTYNIGGTDKRFAVVQGEETNAKTNAPSLTSSYWIYMSDAAASDGAPAWVSGARDYFAGGSYSGEGSNNRSLFLGCYAEGGQGPPQGGGFTVFLQSGEAYNGSSLQGVGHRLVGNGMGLHKRRADGQYMSFLLGGPPSILNADVMVTFGNETSDDPSWRWKCEESQDWYFDYNNANYPIYVPGPSTTRTYGRSAAVGVGFVEIPKLMIGSGNSARLMTVASAMPASGSYAQGDFVKNSGPAISAGKVLHGWERLTTGSGHVAGTDWTTVYMTTT